MEGRRPTELSGLGMHELRKEEPNLEAGLKPKSESEKIQGLISEELVGEEPTTEESTRKGVEDVLEKEELRQRLDNIINESPVPNDEEIDEAFEKIQKPEKEQRDVA